MTKQLLLVPGISCDHCKRAVTETLTSVTGVSAVAVDVPKKTALVEFDERVVTLNQIAAALAAEDYPVVSTTPA